MNRLTRIILATVAALLVSTGMLSAASVKPLPDPSADVPAVKGKQTAVLAGGCFWCTEAVFEELAGVQKVVSGYAGGSADQAHYEMVGSGKTGHAEAIQITYDPSKISYGTLLKVFFAAAHDPTTLDRQGPDWGKQYRSEIFAVNAEQNSVSEAYIKQLNDAHTFSTPIVTKLSLLKNFYSAEEYHQDFVKRNPNHPYVVQNSRPKIEKVRKLFPELLKK
ncbi:MAG: peptide-methionine (S)-S-oxide reductase MsrA [Bryobacteraceae bacterium]|nr:peptide-methionine (S)-S-oxide reductase MsrA [Bryobacteraceae bacterium]